MPHARLLKCFCVTKCLIIFNQLLEKHNPRAYVCLAVHVAEFEVAFSLLGIDNAQAQPILSVPNQLLLLR